MWERGLKQGSTISPYAALCVAPHVGAWIETPSAHRQTFTLKSLPMWERGLKLPVLTEDVMPGESLPMWERGLKLDELEKQTKEEEVAPHVGAWIETTDFLIIFNLF